MARPRRRRAGTEAGSDTGHERPGRAGRGDRHPSMLNARGSSSSRTAAATTTADPPTPNGASPQPIEPSSAPASDTLPRGTSSATTSRGRATTTGPPTFRKPTGSTKRRDNGSDQCPNRHADNRRVVSPTTPTDSSAPNRGRAGSRQRHPAHGHVGSTTARKATFGRDRADLAATGTRRPTSPPPLAEEIDEDQIPF